MSPCAGRRKGNRRAEHGTGDIGKGFSLAQLRTCCGIIGKNAARFGAHCDADMDDGAVLLQLRRPEEPETGTVRHGMGMFCGSKKAKANEEMWKSGTDEQP